VWRAIASRRSISNPLNGSEVLLGALEQLRVGGELTFAKESGRPSLAHSVTTAWSRRAHPVTTA
jgi:hypothetical protein